MTVTIAPFTIDVGCSHTALAVGCGFYLTRAELQTALKLGEQCQRLAQSVQDPALLIQAYYLLGATLFCLGNITLAREYAEQGTTIYNPQHYSPRALYGQNPRVACLFWLAWALWYLGYPDQALEKSHEALNLAQEISRPYNEAIAFDLLAFVCQFRREGRAAQEYAEASIALSTRLGFKFFLEMGTILQGWALVIQGQVEEGVAQIRRGLAAWRATGAELYWPYWLALLAEGYGRLGQTEEGLTTLTEALNTAHKNGERFYEAELYRLKGELLLALSQENQSEAETCFHKAIEVARWQSAKSLELRVVMSLSRLWQRQGKKEEARKILSEIYGWFTEGFDTRDLKEARGLIQELS